MSIAPRHPLITVLVVAAAGATAIVLAFFLVVVPLTNAVVQAPAQLAHVYQGYWNAVGQEFQQAQQQSGGRP